MDGQSTDTGAERRWRVPVSTYRLQFHRGFTFEQARDLVPYLAALGITDCYSSPHLKASPGSTHGYDICDHNQLNPEVGAESEYAAFTSALSAHGMGQVVDFVPNHMGIDASTNGWWRDVLENGRCSSFAAFFDIDWDPIKSELEEKVLLPILGDQYGLVLERGELRVVYEDGSFVLRYFDKNLPINPRQFPRVLEHGLESLQEDLGDDDPRLLELLSIATSLRNLPAYTETDTARVTERHREKEVARERLQRLIESSSRLRRHVEDAVAAFNGRVGERASFDRLHELLEAQPYRLSYWRTASHEINYRRFFDINDLAGLRMEDPAVFEATHGLILRLVGEGKITGLRLDHIDGLFDPERYLVGLQEAICRQAGTAPGQPDGSGRGRSFYVVAEKILSRDESLPEHWPVAGTSGYDFLNELNGLFVDRRNQRALARVYRRFTGRRDAFADLVYQCKKLIMDTPMASELNVLAEALNRLSECDRRTRDFTLNSLREALREVVACFPIYRTYLSAASCADHDRAAVDAAVRQARRRNPTVESSIFDFLRGMLLSAPEDRAGGSEHGQRLMFAMKLQQYTGPVQAKGVEDTAFYRYNLLASLNEVGGDPAHFGTTPVEFHAANRRRRQCWPHAMLASATHDTKRGEDVRARLNVLSEIPEEWGRYVSVWARINASNRSPVEGQPAPDRNDEYLFYQSLLGIWPPGADSGGDVVPRLREYVLKSAREAKVHTSWITQNEPYEQALVRFVERTLAGPTARRFLSAFLPLQRRIAALGMINSLSQLVLRSVCPGVPDFYQGTELWDLNLVDPDNRRPVDYAQRRRLLHELEPSLAAGAGGAERAPAVRALLESWPDGRIKLFLTAALLRARRRLPDLFLDGAYDAAEARGERAENVVGVVRQHGDRVLVAVVPRLVSALTPEEQTPPVGERCWGDTSLSVSAPATGRPLVNLFTGESASREESQGRSVLRVAAVLRTSPVAVLLG
jgi:(1->4)-alpha-D-glucan 1-alpha-D-glucosylmutase